MKDKYSEVLRWRMDNRQYREKEWDRYQWLRKLKAAKANSNERDRDLGEDRDRKLRKDETFSPIRFKSHVWDSLPNPPTPISDVAGPTQKFGPVFASNYLVASRIYRKKVSSASVSCWTETKTDSSWRLKKRLSQKKISVLLFFRQKVFLLFAEKRHKCRCRRKSDDAKVRRRCRHHRSDFSSEIDVNVVCVTLRFVWNKYWLMKVSHRSFPENKFRQVVSARSRRCSTSGSPTLSRSLGRLRAAFPVPDFSSKAPEFPDPKNWSRCPWCPSIRPPSTRRRCRRTRRQRRRWRRPVTTSTTITFRSTWGRRYGVAPSLRSFEGVPTLKQASS